MNKKDKKQFRAIVEQHAKAVAKMPAGCKKPAMQEMFEFLISALTKEAQLNEKADPLIAKTAELIDTLAVGAKVIPAVLEREGADPDGKLKEFYDLAITLLRSEEMAEERKILADATKGMKNYVEKKRRRGLRKIGVI